MAFRLTKIEQIGYNFFAQFNTNKLRGYLQRVKRKRIEENLKVVL